MASTAPAIPCRACEIPAVLGARDWGLESERHYFWAYSALCVILRDMGNAGIDTALDGLIDPLSRCLDAESARRVIELRIDPAVQS